MSIEEALDNRDEAAVRTWAETNPVDTLVDGQTPLYWAIEMRSAKIMRTLLDLGAKATHEMIFRAVSRLPEGITALIHSGVSVADIEKPEWERWGPLADACDREQGLVVFELLNHGMPLRYKGKYRVPLSAALICRATMETARECLSQILDEVCITDDIIAYTYDQKNLQYLLEQEGKEYPDGYMNDGHIELDYTHDRKRIRSYHATRCVYDMYERRAKRRKLIW